MSKIRIFWFWAALVFLAPLAATAQGDGGKSSSKAEAERDFAKAKKLFAKERFAEAAVSFTKAYEAAPHPAVLANIAVCHDKAGDVVKAVTYYRQYLESPVEKAENEEMRVRLEELEAQVAQFEIECALDDCVVWVDGKELGPAPLSIVVLPGAHRIEAVVEDRVSVAVIERIQAASSARVVLEPKAEEPSTVFVKPDEYGPAEERADATGGVILGVPFWIATGTAVVAGALIVVFGMRTLDARDEYQDSEYTDSGAKEGGERDRLITNVMVGVATAAAVTAASFAIYDVVSAEEEQPVALVPGPGLGVAVSGRF